ncbi:CdaR family transcriptional regulator [Robertmurraya korlensis]|uniref:CdaR family transcriptional regulator n=1 Tax=Robertmurraya korlensis TaxID=519977 RepID=UPI000826F7A0|nr:sugar diacid recognition domain-containing protein [Robertmurraya korlensis]
MRITQSLAQEITKKVMDVIPYNVNIMDHEGLIIGSGEKHRIGTFHEGAMEAIQSRKMVSICDSGECIKPGVNIPFQFRDNIVGVIGISGDPQYVAPFAELVKITAELLIQQQFMYKERRIKEQMKEEFLYQWVYRVDHYDSSFMEKSKTLDIDLTVKRFAMIVKGIDQKEKIQLNDQEFLFRLSTDTLLYIVPEKSELLRRLEPLVKQAKGKIGVGTCHQLIAQSIEEAKRALEISEKLSLNSELSFYHDLQFIDYLINSEIDIEDTVTCFKQLEGNPKGVELVETLICFIDNNGDMNTTSHQLHIHRNSLTYRLQKIEFLTKKNPKKFTDLFQLYTGFLKYKIKTR